MLTLQVIRRELQGEVVLLTLAHGEGIDLPAFSAGAHIDLHLADDLVRPYSLCGDPEDRQHYQLGILKDTQSQGAPLPPTPSTWGIGSRSANRATCLRWMRQPATAC